MLQQDITKENCIKCIVASLKRTRVMCLIFTYLMQQCMCETKIYDIDDLRKFLVQTWFDFDIMELAIDQWHDHLTSCVRAGGGHFEHMF